MKQYKKIIDISLSVYKGMVCYPKNIPFCAKPTTPFNSWLTMGAHTGTHVDAPRHAFKNGIGVDRISTAKLIGSCRVLDMTRAKVSLSRKDFERAKIKRGERILVKTRNSKRGYKKFFNDYIFLESEAAEYLAKKGIILFGTDYLSVKQGGSKDNRSHTELLKKKIVIFEGLNLRKVAPGTYFFIGLPLKLVGLDGSPARAVLIK